jgi:hypothetical protein
MKLEVPASFIGSAVYLEFIKGKKEKHKRKSSTFQVSSKMLNCNEAITWNFSFGTDPKAVDTVLAKPKKEMTVQLILVTDCFVLTHPQDNKESKPSVFGKASFVVNDFVKKDSKGSVIVNIEKKEKGLKKNVTIMVNNLLKIDINHSPTTYRCVRLRNGTFPSQLLQQPRQPQLVQLLL